MFYDILSEIAFSNIYVNMTEEIKNLIISMTEKQRREFYFAKNYPEHLCLIKDWGANKWHNFTQLLFHFYHQLDKTPVCRCSNILKFRGFFQGYNKYCSRVCASRDPATFEQKVIKSRKTNIQKYGVDNPAKSKEVKEKIRNTNLKKYGVDNFAKTSQYLEKTKLSNLKKYGTEWFQSTEEFRKKAITTNLQRYGTDHHTKNLEFKKEQKIRNTQKWIFSEVNKSEYFKRKREKYSNSEKFLQSIQLLKETNKVKFFNYYKNYNSSIQLVAISNGELKYNCKNCGSDFDISKQLVYLRTKHHHDVCTNCNPTNSKNYSQTEKDILRFILSVYGGDVIENYKIGKQEIDIFIPSLKLGFDFNGLYWHSEKYKDKSFHLSKKIFFEQNGIELIYIWENEWLYKNDIVMSMISIKLGCCKAKIFSRKCKTTLIEDNYLITQFFELNHLDGYMNHDICVGIKFEDELLMLASFKKLNSRKYQLTQFATLKNTIVVGGLSKILNYSKTFLDSKTLVTKSDYSRTNGFAYQKIGFQIQSISEPKYFWAKNKKKLEINCKDAFKVWNCGYQIWNLKC